MVVGWMIKKELGLGYIELLQSKEHNREESSCTHSYICACAHVHECTSVCMHECV